MMPDSCGESLVAAVAADAEDPPPEPRYDRAWEIRLFDSYSDPTWAASRPLVGEVRYLTMLEASASCRYVTFSAQVDGTSGLFVVRTEDGEMVRVSDEDFIGGDIDEAAELLIATTGTPGAGWDDTSTLTDPSVSGIWTADLEVAFDG